MPEIICQLCEIVDGDKIITAAIMRNGDDFVDIKPLTLDYYNPDPLCDNHRAIYNGWWRVKDNDIIRLNTTITFNLNVINYGKYCSIFD